MLFFNYIWEKNSSHRGGGAAHPATPLRTIMCKTTSVRGNSEDRDKP